MVNKSDLLCDAMVKAGIRDADSIVGIEYCTEHCPYKFCVLFDDYGTKHDYRVAHVKKLYSMGYSLEYIAGTLDISTVTARIYLKEEAA